MHCSPKFVLLTQNRFGHPEIKIGYRYEFLAVQLNLPGDVHDRSICNLDAKTIVVGQIFLCTYSHQKISYLF